MTCLRDNCQEDSYLAVGEEALMSSRETGNLEGTAHMPRTGGRKGPQEVNWSFQAEGLGEDPALTTSQTHFQLGTETCPPCLRQWVLQLPEVSI